jgi:hypothetical protein
MPHEKEQLHIVMIADNIPTNNTGNTGTGR